MNTQKGYEFEHEVEAVLRALQAKFPLRVKVTSQKEFRDTNRPHRADFELEYKIGGLTHQHLIECQHRDKSSHEIADKIYAVRGTSDRNRYILVYKDAVYLTDSVAKRLAEMGVLHFDFEAFKTSFITQLEADIALHGIGLSFVTDPDMKSTLDDILKKSKHEETLKRLRESAERYDYRRRDPPDRAMTSGR